MNDSKVTPVKAVNTSQKSTHGMIFPIKNAMFDQAFNRLKVILTDPQTTSLLCTPSTPDLYLPRTFHVCNTMTHDTIACVPLNGKPCIFRQTPLIKSNGVHSRSYLPNKWHMYNFTLGSF